MKLIMTLEVDVPEGATVDQVEEAVQNVHRNPLEIASVGLIYDWAGSTFTKVAE